MLRGKLDGVNIVILRLRFLLSLYIREEKTICFNSLPYVGSGTWFSQNAVQVLLVLS
jgi:hypothetical protein